jgi:delta 1-pyrroline-5-carboxylate dehydrogenase
MGKTLAERLEERVPVMERDGYHGTAALLREAARAVREAVPEGMVLVPREATEAMEEAAANYREQTRDWHWAGVYQALLAAAPTQDQEKGS